MRTHPAQTGLVMVILAFGLEVLCPPMVLGTEPFATPVYYSHEAVVVAPRGARSIAMGIAGVADLSDPVNSFLNPGNLVAMKGVSFTFTNVEVSDIGDVLDFAVFGGGELSLGDATRVNIAAGLRYSLFRAGGRTFNWASQLTLAGGLQAHNISFGFGLTGKTIETFYLEPPNDQIVALDAGISLASVFGDTEGYHVEPRVGISLLNVGESIEPWRPVFLPSGNPDIEAPEQFRYGLSVQLNGPFLADELLWKRRRNLRVTGSIDWFEHNRSDVKGNGYGVEFVLIDLVALRIGHADQVKADYWDPGEFVGLTYGAGILFDVRRINVRINYARYTMDSHEEHGRDAVDVTAGYSF